VALAQWRASALQLCDAAMRHFPDLSHHDGTGTNSVSIEGSEGSLISTASVLTLAQVAELKARLALTREPPSQGVVATPSMTHHSAPLSTLKPAAPHTAPANPVPPGASAHLGWPFQLAPAPSDCGNSSAAGLMTLLPAPSDCGNNSAAGLMTLLPAPSDCGNSSAAGLMTLLPAPSDCGNSSDALMTLPAPSDWSNSSAARLVTLQAPAGCGGHPLPVAASMAMAAAVPATQSSPSAAAQCPDTLARTVQQLHLSGQSGAVSDVLSALQQRVASCQQQAAAAAAAVADASGSLEACISALGLSKAGLLQNSPPAVAPAASSFAAPPASLVVLGPPPPPMPPPLPLHMAAAGAGAGAGAGAPTTAAMCCAGLSTAAAEGVAVPPGGVQVRLPAALAQPGSLPNGTLPLQLRLLQQQLGTGSGSVVLDSNSLSFSFAASSSAAFDGSSAVLLPNTSCLLQQQQQQQQQQLLHGYLDQPRWQ
jgi:hypothetical protein